MGAAPIIEFQNITKRFPGVTALDGVSFSVPEGACMGLVGENGAGKSTLGKILAGLHRPSEGAISLRGQPSVVDSPLTARRLGIGMVHQELAFCPNLSIAENLCLGVMPRFGPFLDKAGIRARAKRMLQQIGADFDVRRPISSLTTGQEQLVQIAAAVGTGAEIIVFDEPTSSLSQGEAEHLFRLIAELKARRITILYVSHRLEEIFALCDSVTVLRDSRHVSTQPIGELDEGALVSLMIGRRIEEYFPEHTRAAPGEELLRVENLSSPGKIHDVSFAVRRGEVLGLAGLVGAGRSECAMALFGLDSHATGKTWVKGAPQRIRSARHALRCGIGMVPEDRKRQGLALGLSITQNTTLACLRRLATGPFTRRKRERALAEEYAHKLNLRAPDVDAVVASLSGGNQQKVALAKWLAANVELLILDEPTRGIDVGAKAEIHGLIDRMAKEGKGILLISSELPEVLNLSTRIVVFREGRIAGTLSREEATQDAVMRLMAGVKKPNNTSTK